MDAQSGHLAPDEVAALRALFGRLGQWGNLELVFQDGQPVVAHVKLTFKSPLPRWLRLLAAANPESLTGRPP